MPRQPNRRPSIYKGADGLWHCYVTLGTKPNGKPDRRHRQGATATEVATKVDELLERSKRGGTVPAKVQTVEQWLTYWVENVVRPTRAWGTYTAYRALIERYAVPHIGAWRLDGHARRLEPEHLLAMYEGLKTTKVSRGKAKMAPSTILKMHRMLRKSFKDAVRRGKASRNACDLIDAPTARRGKVAAHTLAEAQAIITAAMADPLAARWLLGMLLGPRQGETLGLRWHRVHLDPPGDETPYAKLETQLQRRPWQHGCADPHACGAVPRKASPGGYHHFAPCPSDCRRHRSFKRGCPPPCPAGCTKHARHCPMRTGGGLLEVELKTEESVRPLPLPPVVVELLRRHRQQQQRERQLLGLTWDPEGLVFTTAAGTPIDPGADHGAWEALLRRAGVADSKLHAARHTAGTMLVASGADISVVQELLGHTDIKTARIYVDVAKKTQREAVDRVVSALMDGNLAALLQRDGATTRPAA